MADDTSKTDTNTEPEEPTGDQPEEPTEPTEPEEPEQPAAGEEPAKGDDKPKPTKPGDKLGDPGKRALESERKARRDAEKDLKALKAKVQEFEDRDKSDLERATSRAEEAETRVAAALSRAVKSEVKAQAANLFTDPEDAAAFLDLSKYAADLDGEIDAEQIGADLSDLLERKPHLAKAAPAPEPRRTPAPDPSQGSSGNRKTTADPANIFAGFVRERLQ